MLTKNLCPELGLVNNARGILHEFIWMPRPNLNIETDMPDVLICSFDNYKG